MAEVNNYLLVLIIQDADLIDVLLIFSHDALLVNKRENRHGAYLSHYVILLVAAATHVPYKLGDCVPKLGEYFKFGLLDFSLFRNFTFFSLVLFF